MKQRVRLNWRADYALAVCVIVLWSFGRVLNSLAGAALYASQGISPTLAAFEALYVLAHIALFLFVFNLLVLFFLKNGWPRRWAGWGELFLYAYVLAGILVSLYFLAFQFGYLSPSLDGLIPTGS